MASKTKKVKKRKRKSFLFLKLGIFFIFLLLTFFVVDSFFLSAGKIQRSVHFLERNISHYNRDEFSQYLTSLEEQQADKKITIQIKGSTFIVSPRDLGISFHDSLLWDKAYRVGRDENFVKRFFFWISSFFTEYHLPYQQAISLETIQKNLSAWEREAQLQEVSNGSVSINGMEVITVPPHDGEKIDEESFLQEIERLLFEDTDREELSITPKIIKKSSTRKLEELRTFSLLVQRLIDQPIELSNDKFEDINLTLNPQDLVDIINIANPKNGTDPLKFSIDDLKFAEKLKVLQARDAKFIINDDYSVTILPGRNGADVNLEKTKENLIRELLKDNRGTVHIAIDDIIIPNFSRVDANRLGVNHVVSEFTTHHPCCATRVENIHRIADLLDNKIIKPGEIFNVNTFLGERTKEKGFKEAGSIMKGKMVTSVGGGISQFITTLHNALYWGGYEIVKHKPHSIYFSRYPHGIDATINWPDVDYIFRNDTEYAMVIDTEYTDTSITVRILGNNDGRIIKGDHQRWATPMQILQEGGDKARRVVSEVKPPFDFHPPVKQYVSDEKMPRYKSILIKKGKDGWKTLVTRKIFVGDELYRHDVWPVFYDSGKPDLYKIHPCDNPQEENKPQNCS